MKYKFCDFNGGLKILSDQYPQEDDDLRKSLKSLVLHVKESDQEGKQGSLIFNPVGTNEALKELLQKKSWSSVSLPQQYSFFGLGVDFGKKGVCIEAQFSNYPFLLNNTLRSEVLYRDKFQLVKNYPLNVLVFITKVHSLPSSNSTLYYEQAVEHLKGLATHNIFSIPIVVFGLDCDSENEIAELTTYAEKRYSRTVLEKKKVRLKVHRPQKEGGICKLVIK